MSGLLDSPSKRVSVEIMARFGESAICEPGLAAGFKSG